VNYDDFGKSAHREEAVVNHVCEAQKLSSKLQYYVGITWVLRTRKEIRHLVSKSITNEMYDVKALFHKR